MPKSQSDSHAVYSVYTAQHDNEDTSHHIQNFNHSHYSAILIGFTIVSL